MIKIFSKQKIEKYYNSARKNLVFVHCWQEHESYNCVKSKL